MFKEGHRLAQISQAEERHEMELETLTLSVIGALNVHSPLAANAFRQHLYKILRNKNMNDNKGRDSARASKE